MTKETLKQEIIKEIDRNRQEIIRIGRQIYTNPELGFKEEKTSALVRKTFQDLNIPYQDHLALTGVKAVAKGRNSNARALVMGELDAVVCPLHKNADLTTGAAHSCGHHGQIASMLGAAMGLAPFMRYLDGDAVFIAVPAEEYVELEYRQRLKQDGKIEFFGGKQEFIRLGLFDGIDAGMMVHSHAGLTDRKFLISCDSSGFVGKVIRFEGREAHAGAAPYLGVNALNAAALALMAINSNRETFKDSDRIRVHPIITKGGDLVNIVPADVRMETYVRGRTIEAVTDASEKVDRAIMGSAYAIGAKARIEQIPGYLPLIQNEKINALFAKNGQALLDGDACLYGYELMGATDAGDVSSVIPFAHLSGGGFSGQAHSRDFDVCDEEMAYVLPAKAMAATMVDLLCDGAKEALAVRAAFRPKFTRDEYVAFWRGFNRTQE